MDIIHNNAIKAPVRVSRYALEEDPVLVPTLLASVIGHNEAMLLNQIHYWLEKGAGTVIDGVNWVYNTIKEWSKQLRCMSFDQVRRAIEHLEDLQILKSCKPWKHEWNQRKAYRINYDRLETLQASIWHQYQIELAEEPNRTGMGANSLTEITSKTIYRDNKHVVVEKVFENLNPEKSSEQNSGCTEVALKTNPKNQGTHLPPQTQRQDQKNPGGARNIPEIIAEVETVVAPKELKPHLHAFVMESIATLGEQAVSDAIAAAKEYKEQQQAKHRKVKNPTGLVRKAITEKWKPNKRSLPRGFKQWIKLARQVGVAIASCFENGALYVFTPDGQRHLYEEYKLIHPIETLRE